VEIDLQRHKVNGPADEFKSEAVLEASYAYYGNEKCLEPPAIQRVVYKKVHLGVMHFTNNYSEYHNAAETVKDVLLPNEHEFLKLVIRNVDEVKWAIENSYDGVHIFKERDMFRAVTKFALIVYLNEKAQTWWTLKYG